MAGAFFALSVQKICVTKNRRDFMLFHKEQQKTGTDSDNDTCMRKIVLQFREGVGEGGGSMEKPTMLKRFEIESTPVSLRHNKKR